MYHRNYDVKISQITKKYFIVDYNNTAYYNINSTHQIKARIKPYLLLVSIGGTVDEISIDIILNS